MSRLLRLLPLSLLATLACAAAPLALPAPARPDFAQATSDLTPDPTAHFGRLPNGFRYVIYPNHEPKGRVSLRLLVLAGSLHETDDQLGLAHFLEHMAFNGGDHFKPGTLVEFFQRMGMSFGGDTNANTSFDRTLYLLELPDTKPATLAEGLSVLADDAGGLFLQADMVEKERGIILSEKRVRDSVDFRIFVSQFTTIWATRCSRSASRSGRSTSSSTRRATASWTSGTPGTGPSAWWSWWWATSRPPRWSRC